MIDQAASKAALPADKLVRLALVVVPGWSVSARSPCASSSGWLRVRLRPSKRDARIDRREVRDSCESGFTMVSRSSAQFHGSSLDRR
jgi:hypothetical protein